MMGDLASGNDSGVRDGTPALISSLGFVCLAAPFAVVVFLYRSLQGSK